MRNINKLIKLCDNEIIIPSQGDFRLGNIIKINDDFFLIDYVNFNNNYQFYDYAYFIITGYNGNNLDDIIEFTQQLIHSYRPLKELIIITCFLVLFEIKNGFNNGSGRCPEKQLNNILIGLRHWERNMKRVFVHLSDETKAIEEYLGVKCIDLMNGIEGKYMNNLMIVK